MLCQRLLVQGHGYPGVHKVQPAGQSGQHPGRVLLAAGLAQHPVVDGHHGVGGDDQGAGVGGGHLGALLPGQLLHQLLRGEGAGL